MSGSIDLWQPAEKMDEACSRNDFSLNDMAGLFLEAFEYMLYKSACDTAETLQDLFGNHLDNQLIDVGDHLLIHQRIAFFDPWGQTWLTKQFLDRDSHGTVEGSVVFEEQAFFDESKSVNDTDAMSPI